VEVSGMIQHSIRVKEKLKKKQKQKQNTLSTKSSGKDINIKIKKDQNVLSSSLTTHSQHNTDHFITGHRNMQFLFI
jgi:hypothetical protein